MPYAVPAVVAAIMWSFLLVPQYGSYTKVAEALGASNADFFSTNLILPTIIVIVIWEVVGYNMVIFFTALKSVPNQVVEAAVLDGASIWAVIFRVKLPMIRSAVVMLTFLNLIGAMQLFTEPSIISTFEPQAISFGFTPALFIYNTSIGNGQYNLGAAAAVVFAVVIAIASIGSLLVARRRSALA